MNRFHNPNCDGSHCHAEAGEVRVYPLGGGANLILCRPCWAQENRYRYDRATIDDRGMKRKQPDHENWPQVNWDRAERYPEKRK